MGRGSNWTPEDDVILVRGWIHYSQDCITGSQQKGARFWQKVMEFCFSHEIKRTRTMKSAQGRWRMINFAVSKFGGIMCQLRPASGTNIEDDEKAALEAYTQLVSSKGKSFDYMHCWAIMKQHKKWSDPTEDDALKDVGAEPNEDEIPEDNTMASEETHGRNSTTTRPIGVKRAKQALRDEKLNEKIYKELQEANAIAKKREFDFKMGLAFNYFSVPEHEIPEDAKALFAFTKKRLMNDLTQGPNGVDFLSQPNGGRHNRRLSSNSNRVPASSNSSPIPNNNDSNQEDDEQYGEAEPEQLFQSRARCRQEDDLHAEVELDQQFQTPYGEEVQEEVYREDRPTFQTENFSTFESFRSQLSMHNFIGVQQDTNIPNSDMQNDSPYCPDFSLSTGV